MTRTCATESEALHLITPASHHFVSSSLANQAGLLKNAGEPFVEIQPDDAAREAFTPANTSWYTTVAAPAVYALSSPMRPGQELSCRPRDAGPSSMVEPTSTGRLPMLWATWADKARFIATAFG